MINLIKADFYKEKTKKSFLLCLLLIIMTTFIYMFFVNKNLVTDNIDNIIYPKLSKKEYLSINKNGNYNLYLKEYKNYEKIALKENKAKHIKYEMLLTKSYPLYYILGLIIIYLAYHNISYDLQNKTIRYMFMANYTRFKIIISKIINMFIYSIIYFSTIFILTLILSNYFSKSFNLSYSLTYLFNSLQFLIPIFFIIILVFFLTLLFNGNSLSLIFNTVLYIMSTTILNVLLKNNIKIMSFTFIPYLDFTYYINKSSVKYNNTIYNVNLNKTTGIIILLIYSLIIIYLIKMLIKRDY